MSGDLGYIFLSIATLMTAFLAGPSILVARGVLRDRFGPASARAHGRSLAIGVGAGAMAATVLIGLILGGQAAVNVALLTFLVMLAAMDVAWRWLPLEWTLPLNVLGFGAAMFSGDLTSAVLGAALGGGILLALRTGYFVLRNIEALGLGDVWLAAALGAFVGPTHIIWLLGGAACFGLVLYFSSRSSQPRRMGVAFGAHLCVATPIFVAF